MRAVLISLLFLTISQFCFCQNKKEIAISGGRVLFGTGDIPGYSVNIELNKNLIMHPKAMLAKLMVGLEFSFENGSKDPKVINPTFQEFISKTFYHTSNSILTIKVSYFPITKTFLRGLNICIGPSIGYTNQSSEFQSSFIVDPATQESIRRSYLTFYKNVIIGYRISAGYVYNFKKDIFAGIRLDFSNYNNGDINTLAGLKIGFSF
jgi:hypothetical protein